jgi:hypothetical protein
MLGSVVAVDDAVTSPTDAAGAPAFAAPPPARRRVGGVLGAARTLSFDSGAAGKHPRVER